MVACSFLIVYEQRTTNLLLVKKIVNPKLQGTTGEGKTYILGDGTRQEV
jgi:hypothetical protein